MILHDAREGHDAHEVRLGFAHHDMTVKELFVHWQAIQFT